MTAPDKPEASVVTATTSNRRTLFSGLLVDAKEYVERNFPRVHVNPGDVVEPHADVHVVGSDGSRVAYHGAGSGGDNGWHDVDESGTVQTNAVAAPAQTDVNPAVASTEVPPPAFPASA